MQISPLPERILQLFPPYMHALLVVYDPDRLLQADRLLGTELVERGFSLLSAENPDTLHADLLRLQPYRIQQPILVTCSQRPTQLPAKLQTLLAPFPQIDISFHMLFPHLWYPTLRTLPLAHLARLLTLPDRRLGLRQTERFLLRHLYAVPDLAAEHSAEKSTIKAWLDRHTARFDTPMPRQLITALVQRWQPLIPDVPLAERLGGPSAADVVAASPLREAAAPTPTMLLLAQMAQVDGAADWRQWQQWATTWARIGRLRDEGGLNSAETAQLTALQPDVDHHFLQFLQTHYARLATRSYPTPKHLWHVPSYLARQRQKVVLLVLDGVALQDWLLLEERWRDRFVFDRQLLLAQVPSITPVSRQALISGKRPADFGDALHSNARERRQWEAWWADKGLHSSAVAYARLKLQSPAAILLDARHHALCVVNSDVDDRVHGAQNSAEFWAAYTVWVDNHRIALARLIEQWQRQGRHVYLTSDHGHVQATGVGRPRDGVTVETRGKRARLYRDKLLAAQVHAEYRDTMLWGSRGVLPPDAWAVLPTTRMAFAPKDEIVVSHGGLTVEEMVVPFVRIDGKSKNV